MNQIMKNPKMREASFFINIISAILTGIILAYMNAITTTQTTQGAKMDQVALDVVEIKGNIGLLTFKVDANTGEISRIDATQRGRTSTFEGMNEWLFDRHQPYKDKPGGN